MRILQTFALLFIVASCFAQTDTVPQKKMIWGVNVGMMVSSGPVGPVYYAYGTLEKGKSFFAIGPAVGPKPVIPDHGGVDYYDKFTLNGAHLVYRINPNPTNKRFNFFFEYNLLFSFNKDNGKEHYYTNNNFAIQSYKATQTLIENYIGYGFKVKFLKNFYVNQSVGFGIIYRSRHIDYEISHDNNPSDTELGFCGRLGLGYRFNKTK